VRNSYGEIEGGLPHLGLVDLTGGVGTKWTITPGSTSQDSLPTRQMWEKLKGGLLTKDTLVGAGSTSGRDTEATPRGIAKGHAYAILQVQSNVELNNTSESLCCYNLPSIFVHILDILLAF